MFCPTTRLTRSSMRTASGRARRRATIVRRTLVRPEPLASTRRGSLTTLLFVTAVEKRTTPAPTVPRKTVFPEKNGMSIRPCSICKTVLMLMILTAAMMPATMTNPSNPKTPLLAAIAGVDAAQAEATEVTTEADEAGAHSRNLAA